MATNFEWVTAIGGVVAGLGGIASVVLALKSINLYQATQKKVDEILDDDRRYKEFLDRHIARGLEVQREQPGGGSTQTRVKINEPENAKYLARAVREGIFAPTGYAFDPNSFWVIK